jgi:hypothetical protein
MVDGYTLQVTSYKDETNAIILTNPNLKLIPSLFLTSLDEKNMWLSHILFIKSHIFFFNALALGKINLCVLWVRELGNIYTSLFL